jgi:hypothetical protein
MRALQVEFPSNGVCSDFHRSGVFIGPWGSSTDLAEVVTHQVVGGRPRNVAGRLGVTSSTAFAFHFSCRHLSMKPQAKPTEDLADRPGIQPASWPLGPFSLEFGPLSPRVKYTLMVMMILTFGQLHFVIP